MECEHDYELLDGNQFQNKWKCKLCGHINYEDLDHFYYERGEEHE